jgi:pimeloyl-ACP methyl ester carboxylesterase
VSRFILVHGAFHGAWCWELVAPRLQSSGHTVTAIDLPGCGADETPAAEVTLEASAERVADTLRAGDPAVLVGHGAGGAVITQAAAIAAAHIERLVYVCALVPRDGESVQSLARAPEGTGDRLQDHLLVQPPEAVLPPSVARTTWYGTSSPERAEWAIERLGPQPLAPLVTPVTLGGGIDPIDRHYILTLEDRAIPPARQRQMAHDNPGREVAELGCDHAPFLSMPEELVALLERFARD